jgi:uncharacterized membrane protein (DUF4010 family)
MNLDLAVQMAHALGIGLLVGLERTLVQLTTGPTQEQSTREEEAPDQDSAADERLVEFPGVRTFTVFSLVGYASALVGEQIPFLGPVALGGVIALVVAMYIRAADFGTGITTEAAGVCTCLLGMLCRHNTQAAGVLALLLTVLLASKRFTHETVRKMRRVELTDTLKFLVVILIVLPLLPREPIDPYGVVNPYKIGFLVVLISGISFVGYFLTRILGAKRGLGLTGVLGGLTSSTAVTAAMAAEAKQRPGLGAICAFSTVAANATMFLRVLVVVAVLDRTLALRLAWGIGTMTVVAAVASVVLWLRASKPGAEDSSDSSAEVQLKNPFSVWPAVKFAAFFVGILLTAKLARLYLGDRGLFAAAALSGLADVDAITLTIAEQTGAASLSHATGAIGIVIAVVSNSVVKTGISVYSGGLRFGRIVGICLGAATLAGLAVVFALPS